MGDGMVEWCLCGVGGWVGGGVVIVVVAFVLLCCGMWLMGDEWPLKKFGAYTKTHTHRAEEEAAAAEGGPTKKIVRRKKKKASDEL
jgi:uncharacterized membrane protein YdbT with pleckstrin-like domain